MSTNLKFQAHAKCIIAGEHSVLRGYPAIIVPLPNKTLTLDYQPTHDEFKILIVDNKDKGVIKTTFELAFQAAFLLLNQDFSKVQGKFIINNNIELGAGLGFSAALCVVITRWLIMKGFLEEKELFQFAHKLENFFHGQSSGVDVVGAMTDVLVYFQNGKFHELKLKWVPNFYLSYSGNVKGTKEAISQVKSLNEQNPKKGKKIDQEMFDSVCLIEKAFSEQKTLGYTNLLNGIEEAQYCFREWSLINPKLQKHINQLYELGADAVKPTGAGGGGYVLSLWQNTPPQTKTLELTRVL